MVATADRQGIGGEADPCGEARMEMHKHSYTPRDPDTGAETDARTQGTHKATKPEKYTQAQAQKATVRHILSDPQAQQTHTHAPATALPGASPCPTHMEEGVAKTAGTLAPKHWLSAELQDGHGPQPPSLSLRLLLIKYP